MGIAPVPEPQACMLMLLGLTVVLVRRKARA
ncbi:PEP-CTERM sorting domain-containing protein [Pseudoduganella plicata]|uniref:PEP-CTERM sorting domain-containing protein n=1 Tax=Pseudoduganella plicata TaxID=321984 RepID=A0ABX5S9W4_9BURK|nr:PEP-CTERM sorting domain-containing protein [Pseudoduganella plicata]QBQ36372.1 PEP-CTERM sorting domain-containing protein [Pseudoduganella plicata]